ncbi:MAG: hypothetical protein BWK80_11915 [Desulfobacteraceae bacterium IS3]|nr:MAG: hypothetical protein BWK80_11915 [Desulfobacteraceae bacterium IS3]
MPVRIRITVISGKCQGNIHEIGQEFFVEKTTPQGICLGAWNSIAPYITALLLGGDLPSVKEKGVMKVHCPDTKGITLEIRRIE